MQLQSLPLTLKRSLNSDKDALRCAGSFFNAKCKVQNAELRLTSDIKRTFFTPDLYCRGRPCAVPVFHQRRLRVWIFIWYFSFVRSCRSGTYFGSFERQSKQSALFVDIRRSFIEKCSPPSTADSAAQKFAPLPNAKASASLKPQMPDAAARFSFSTKRSPPASAVSAAGKVVREIKCSRGYKEPLS